MNGEHKGRQHAVWIVEDEPSVGALAAEVCEELGAAPVVFSAPTPFRLALNSAATPSAIVLDWRLENRLSAELFLATRHRYPEVPVIYWTGAPDSLPTMVRNDGHTTVVAKQGGVASLERALTSAFGRGGEDQSPESLPSLGVTSQDQGSIHPAEAE